MKNVIKILIIVLVLVAIIGSTIAAIPSFIEAADEYYTNQRAEEIAENQHSVERFVYDKRVGNR